MSASTLQIGTDSSRLSIEVIQRLDRVAWTSRLTLRDGPHLAATVESAYLIPEAHEADGLVGFFEDIAEHHWTGWNGAKSWANLEHNLTIDAKWQRTGGATLSVTLIPEGQRWQVRGQSRSMTWHLSASAPMREPSFSWVKPDSRASVTERRGHRIMWLPQGLRETARWVG